MALTPHPFIPGNELTHDMIQGDMEINLDDPPEIGSMSFLETADGGMMETDLDPSEFDGISAESHDENLADLLSETALDGIAQQIEEWVDADVRSRKQWHDKLASGLELIGVVHAPVDDSASPFKLTEKVNHPLIAEAAVQFQARAVAELVPPGGPAKGTVVGKRDREKDEQAVRVADYLNYQLMTEDRDYYPETDRMLFMLAVEGSQFKKVYHDDLIGRNVSRWIRGEDFIVPYGVTTLRSAPRYTHQMVVERNDMKRLQASGFYREASLMEPVEGPHRNDRIKDNRDRAQGQEESSDMVEDVPHTVWECHCDYDLGLDGDDGVARPYVISVEKESRKVLSIRRNWNEGDPRHEKIISFVHFPYLPGDGFYSYGLIHMLGGLGNAATGLLKTILTGAAFAAFRGGFKSKDAKLPKEVEMQFGKYIDTDMSAEELSKCFYEPKFSEPPESLFKVLGALEVAGQRFSSTTENMVGDASNNGPVGTTVALIEQGSKVFSGIHKRLHYAQGEELRLLADLNGKHLPDEGYPYSIPGEDRQILRTDFDGRIDVIPVSDPNIFSSTQRIAVAQSLRQMAMEQPGMFDQRKVLQRMLDAMRVPDPDDVLLDPSKIKRQDPVTENSMLMVSRAVRSFADQAHDAHIAVHMDLFHRLEAMKHPLFQQIGPAILSHIAEHEAYKARNDYMMAMMGIPLPPMDLYDMDDEFAEEISPEVENQIAQIAAMSIARLPKPPMAQQGDPAMQQQQQAMEEQARALEEEAANLEEVRKQLETTKAAIDKDAVRLQYERQVNALLAKIEKIKRDAEVAGHRHEAQSVLDKAVSRVEGSLRSSREQSKGASRKK